MRTRVSTKGQVVIPRAAREALGLEQGDELEVRVEGERILLEKAPQEREDWRRWEGRFEEFSLTADLVNEHRREVEGEGLP
ncbi:MAG: AbrB/MazE/SpoVT family DNA-binding domain-containing protein [Acidobacteriota bacterium]|jgi:AbrB family looped-hinge helix DNA binding protein